MKEDGSVLMCYVQCCECRTFIDVKETNSEEAQISHSLCPECFEEAMVRVRDFGARRAQEAQDKV